MRRVCEGVFKGLRTEEKRLYVDALAQVRNAVRDHGLMGHDYDRTPACGFSPLAYNWAIANSDFLLVAAAHV